MTLDGDIATLLGAVFGAGGVGGAIAYVWKERETFYKFHMTRLEAEIKAGRDKIDELQGKLLSQSHSLTAAVTIQAETYQKLARSLEENNATLKEALKTVKP